MRYRRQTQVPGIGEEGQALIREARVLCVGLGGLGCPSALYLTGAGVGTLGLLDGDTVQLSNLHRQILYQSEDAGRLKVEAARDHLQKLNPEVELRAHPVFLSAENALEILDPYDVILDGTDRFETKHLINDACLKLGKPWVYASALQWEGQLAVFDGRVRGGPCYRCLRPDSAGGAGQTCAEGGVIGPVVGMLGIEQALLALQTLLPGLPARFGVLQVFDGLALEWLKLKIPADPDCPSCQRPPEALILSPAQVPEIRVAELRERLKKAATFTLLDVREKEEWDHFHLGPALHWPLGRVEQGEFPDLAHEREIVLYCQSGQRSRRAAELFAAAGFQRVSTLVEGISAWDFAPEAC